MKKFIGVLFSDWQKKQSGHEIFLILKSFSVKYNTLFKIYIDTYVGLYLQ